MRRKGGKPEREAELEAELACPPLPEPLVYLWSIFARLSSRRSSNGFGPNLITYPEIDAFQRITGFRFTPWEVEMIELVDILFINEHSRSRNESDD